MERSRRFFLHAGFVAEFHVIQDQEALARVAEQNAALPDSRARSAISGNPAQAIILKCE